MLPLAHTGLNEPPVSLENNAAALMFDERGMIRDFSRSVEKLVGYLRSELVWHHISFLLPQLKKNLFQAGISTPRSATCAIVAIHFKFRID